MTADTQGEEARCRGAQAKPAREPPIGLTAFAVSDAHKAQKRYRRPPETDCRQVTLTYRVLVS